MATAIRTPADTARPASPSHHLPGLGRLAMILEIFLGIGALFGGIQFMLAPDGHLLGVPVSMLTRSPFHSFFIPVLLLSTLVGVAPIVAAAITARRPSRWVVFAGFTSLFWALYLVPGTVIAAVGVAWRRSHSARNELPTLTQGEEACNQM